MKKSILHAAAIAAMAAIVGVACNDGGLGESHEAKDYLNRYSGTPDDTLGGNSTDNLTLTVTINPSDGGIVKFDPQRPSYKAGDTVTLTAEPNTGFTFLNWSGAVGTDTDTLKVVMNSDMTLYANFNQNAVEIDTVPPTIVLNGKAAVEAYKDVPFTDPGASASDGLSYTTQIKNAEKKDVDSVNTSAIDTFFITYTACKNLKYPDGTNANACASVTREVRVIELPEVPPTCKLTTGAEPEEGGDVTRVPNKEEYTVGDTVTVTAKANTGYKFVRWTGASQSENSSVKIVMSDVLTLTAIFKPLEYSLTVNANPSDGGGVERNPPNGPYTHGQKVTVTATPNTGYTFKGWSGAFTDANQEVTFNMDSSITLAAEFLQLTYTLTATADPTEGGSVSLEPSEDYYKYGNEVKVTAVPNNGYVFEKWTGAPEKEENPVTITITAATELTAHFVESDSGGDEPTDSTFVDTRDNKTYKKVKIGTQTWMAENLNYAGEFGSEIGVCYDNAPDSCKKYGRLYDWATAMAEAPSSSDNPSGVRGVCPDGWHLPSNAEWTTLTDFVGGESNTVGTKLKSKTGWKNSGNGTDAFGFSALPGGRGDTHGSFGDVGINGYWWTATAINQSDKSQCIRIQNSFGFVYNYHEFRIFLNSVRCVAD